jgi:hypothetical protein
MAIKAKHRPSDAKRHKHVVEDFEKVLKKVAGNPGRWIKTGQRKKHV